MTDVSPKLLEAIKNSFESDYKKNLIITNLKKKIDNGKATYDEVNTYAIEVGELLAKAFRENLSGEVLPDGRMYFNIARAVVEPMMNNNYNLVSNVAVQVQTSLNSSPKIGIKAIRPNLNQDRIDGIINRLASEKNFDEIKWILDEPVVNFTQSIVDDSIRINAEFQYEAGLAPKITRTIAGNCCEWCRNLSGEYSYPEVPRNVYRRHDYCRCKVDYVVGKSRKNIHNNNTGKRRYEKDKYGNYVLTKEARLEHAKQMKATEKVRKEQARQKRIATWNKKKNNTDDYIIEQRKLIGRPNENSKEIKEIKDFMNRQIKKLSEEQQAKLREYTGFTGTRINHAIGTGVTTPQIQKIIDELEEVLKNGIMPKEVVLYRGTSLGFLNLNLPNNPTVEQLKRIEGTIVSNPIFTSMSFKNLNLKGRDTEIWYKIPEGYRGCQYLETIAFPKYKSQEEVLFNRDLLYIIKKTTIKDGKYILEAEVIFNE